MRKVYHTQTNTLALWIALITSLGLTAILFGILPFSHIVATPNRVLELRKTAVAELPPPVEEEATPPPQEEEPAESENAPQLAEAPPAQNLNLNVELEIAAGSGGALAMGQLASSLAAEGTMNDLSAFSVADLDKPPVLVASVAPEYPRDLRKAKVEGSVVLVFLLDENGHVDDPRVESSSRPEFERPALDAVRKWKFKPGVREGTAVRTHMRLPIRFRISS